ncbi:hypothetical protein [Thiomonas sp.]|uniref:type IV pilus assembly protein FimV n=1 Tax=Thiomonas sp. TaxID=2047785 RepID=UPI002627F099|nr:hypothetical protein [Thiomonas sp.]
MPVELRFADVWCGGRLRRAAAALGLTVAACQPAWALMIGAAQTRAELGRPLRMEIPLRLDAGESLPLSCVQAAPAGDLGSGLGALSVSASPTAGGLTLLVHSGRPLRDPIVEVRLHLGCQFQRTQIYTVLVDPPRPELPLTAGSAVAVPGARAPQPATLAATTASAPLAAATTAPMVPPTAARRTAVSTVPAVVHPAALKPQIATPRHAPLARQTAASPTVAERPARAQAHSRLELGDVGSAVAVDMPALRLAVALPPVLPTVTAAQRARLDALRQLVFDAVVAGSDGNPATLQQMQALQARAEVLQRQFAQASQQLQQTQAELAAVRAGSVPAAWLYALAAAVVALLLLSVWLWRRGATAAAADHPFAATPGWPLADAAAVPHPGLQAAAVPQSTLSPPAQRSTMPPPAMPFGLPSQLDGRPLQPHIDVPAPAATPLAEGPPAQTWGHPGDDWDSRFLQPLAQDKQVQVDELMDAGHLAEYFIDMGDDDRAMALLEKSLDDSASDSFALPYLLLFDLYRKHGRKKEFDALYTRFERRFNVAVPPWGQEAAPGSPGRDLTDYDRAMALITQSWGTPQSVTVLEHMLLDDPNQHRMGFDLPAYRDLLMLYAVARDLFPDAVPGAAVAHPASAAPAQTLDLDFELPLADAAPAPPADSSSDAGQFSLSPHAGGAAAAG